jgi:hypothetical protein
MWKVCQQGNGPHMHECVLIEHLEARQSFLLSSTRTPQPGFVSRPPQPCIEAWIASTDHGKHVIVALNPSFRSFAESTFPGIPITCQTVSSIAIYRASPPLRPRFLIRPVPPVISYLLLAQFSTVRLDTTSVRSQRSYELHVHVHVRSTIAGT